MGKISEKFSSIVLESKLFQKCLRPGKLHSLSTQIETIGGDVIAYKRALQEEAGGPVNFIDHPGFFENEAVKKVSKIPGIFGEFLEEEQTVRSFLTDPDVTSRLILLSFCNSVRAVDEAFGQGASALAEKALDSQIFFAAYRECNLRDIKTETTAMIFNLMTWTALAETGCAPDDPASKFMLLG